MHTFLHLSDSVFQEREVSDSVVWEGEASDSVVQEGGASHSGSRRRGVPCYRSCFCIQVLANKLEIYESRLVVQIGHVQLLQIFHET